MEDPPASSVARSDASPTLTENQAQRITREVMRRQAALSLRLSAVFVLILLGLPLLNRFAPEIMRQNVGGFTLTWLVLGVLFYPLTWLLSGSFIRASDTIEQECAEWGRKVLAENAGREEAEAGR